MNGGITTGAGSFLVNFSDPGFFATKDEATNSFSLSGKWEVTFNVDTMWFSGQRSRLFRSSEDLEITFKLSSVVNVSRKGKLVHLEFVAEEIDQKLLAHQLPTYRLDAAPFINLWAENNAKAEQIERLLPKRQSEAFAQAVAEQADFDARLLATTPKAYVTPTLVGINVVVFLAMLAVGAGLFMPNPQVHVLWGANFGPLTTGGQWWRLLTCTFLHFGVVHLAMNMWALYETGRLAERLYGNFFFLVLYLLSGLAGSLSSVMWNPQVNSVGASGAIFGVFGAVLAFMLDKKNLVSFTVMSQHSNSIIFFIVYSLFYGVKDESIDNAAHLGGLASGFLFGLMLARPLDPELRANRGWGQGATIAIGVLMMSVILMFIPRESNRAIDYHSRAEQKISQHD